MQAIVLVWIKAAGTLSVLYSDLNKKRAEEAKADAAAAEAEAKAKSLSSAGPANGTPAVGKPGTTGTGTAPLKPPRPAT